MAIIVISDDIPELLENCNRILLMQAGRIDTEVDPLTTTETELGAMMTEVAPVTEEATK